MRVGFVADTPWVTDSSGQAGGIEARFVREIADSLHARIAWVSGTESHLLETLQHRELDLVIGGLTASSPWKKQLGFTLSYYTDSVVVGGPVHESPPQTVKQVTVAVRRGDPVVAQLRKKGANVVVRDDLDAAWVAVAAPIWQLAKLGRTPNPRLELAQNKHVLAVSPGENAWMMAVEQTLIRDREAIPRLLRQASP